MIPLTTFNAAKVLDGARVRLHPTEADTGRWEWCDDLLIRVSQSPEGILFTPYAQTAGNWEFLGLALDPTDETTARLIDRRVAEAVHPTREISAAVLNTGTANGGWWLTAICSNGDVELTRLQRQCLDEIERCDANLPEARTRLLCALYPPVSA